MNRPVEFVRPLTIALLLMLSNHAAHGMAQEDAPPAAATDAVRMDHISVVARGAGDPVILIPGLSTPRAVWDGVVPALIENHRVHLVQVNGFGGGDPGANLESGILDGVVADLHGYIANHELHGAKVVGHSMGGLVALMLARAYPDDAARVMTVDALPFIGSIMMPEPTVARLKPIAEGVRDRLKAGSGPSARMIAARQAVTPEARKRIARWIAAADAGVSARAVYEDMTTDLRAEMATIETPITLVFPWGGELTESQAYAFYRAAYAGAPNLTQVGIGDSGHFVMLDRPAAFAAALDTFLAD